jgi:predicted nuclease of predicted toxin-antitoxin system
MRLLFDQNISHRILSQLPDYFIGSISVKGANLVNATDREIWEFARKNNLIIVSQDSDFKDLNSLYGFPPKIILIRVGNLRTAEIAMLLTERFSELSSFENDNNFGCFEILSFTR